MLKFKFAKSCFFALDHVREQGARRFKSGAYTKYVSTLNWLATQLSGML